MKKHFFVCIQSLVLLCISLVYVINTSSQVVTDRANERSLVSTRIDKGDARNDRNNPQNLRAVFQRNHSSINHDGNIMIANDRIIKYSSQTNQWEIIDLPNRNTPGFRFPQLNRDGRKAAFVLQDQSSARINFFNTATNSIESEYIHSMTHEVNVLTHFTLADGGRTFTYSIFEPGTDPSGHVLYSVDKLGRVAKTSEVCLCVCSIKRSSRELILIYKIEMERI